MREKKEKKDVGVSSGEVLGCMCGEIFFCFFWFGFFVLDLVCFGLV